MEKLLIIHNVTHQGPGIIADILREKEAQFDTRDMEKYPLHNAADVSLDQYARLIVMGGPQSVNDEYGHIPALRQLIRNALMRNIPYFGICLGHQLLTKATGGTVIRSPRSENGFRTPEGELHEVALTRHGIEDPLTKHLPRTFNAFHWHGEMAVPNRENTAILATGKYCPIQIIRAGKKAYGIQFHPEPNRQMLEDWIMRGLATDSKCSPEKVLDDFERAKAQFKNILGKMLDGFLRL